MVSRSCQVASQSEQPTFVAMTPIRPPRATAHAHHEEHIEGRQGAIGRSVVSEGPLDIPREVRKFRVIGLSMPNRETEERTRTADLLQLRVRGQQLLVVVRACKTS